MIGLIASSAIFIGAMIWFAIEPYLWLQEHGGGVAVRPGGGIMGLVMVFPAVVPGLALGPLAYRLPKSLNLRCPKCTWRAHFKIRRDGSVWE